jgi:aryl-phospho-beta-D-glucosidase BglC (GH1 family)
MILSTLLGFAAAISPPLRTSGNQIVDSNGAIVHLHCVNWSGAHTEEYLTYGLEFQPVDKMMDLLVSGGFSCVRYAFSTEMVAKNPIIKSELLQPNPQLIGKTAIEVYQFMVQEFTKRGLMVILDNHMLDAGWCCTPFDNNGAWFNSNWTEEQFIQNLVKMVDLFKDNKYVIGVDLRNEIRPVVNTVKVFGKDVPDIRSVFYPNWGLGGEWDWLEASERAGNAVLTSNPNLLIIVQGRFVIQLEDIKILLNSQTPKFPQQLRGALFKQPLLRVRNRLVYSSHDYEFHYDVDFNQISYEQFRAIADANYGFVAQKYPLFLGEIGVPDNAAGVGSVYWRYITRYIQENKFHWAYWNFEGVEQDRRNNQIALYSLLNANFTAYEYPPLLDSLKPLMFK